MSGLKVAVCQLPHGADLELPKYATLDSSGMDLLAAVPDQVLLEPGARRIVPTGLTIALPPGYEAQVRPRSGLAVRHGVTVLNSPGTIDADYRGEVGVVMANLGDKPFAISRGMRVAQLVIAPVTRVAWELTDPLPQSGRGTGGFGSTGTG